MREKTKRGKRQLKKEKGVWRGEKGTSRDTGKRKRRQQEKDLCDAETSAQLCSGCRAMDC